jgi:hypothetical protein
MTFKIGGTYEYDKRYPCLMIKKIMVANFAVIL